MCSDVAQDKIGLKMLHLADGIVHTDRINGSNWVFYDKCKRL